MLISKHQPLCYIDSTFKVKEILNKVYVMKNIALKEWKTMTVSQAIKVLQKESTALWFKWKDELSEDFLSEVEFLLGLKGRWLLCHMGKEYPYTIRFRLIWERDYTKCKPREFMDLAKQKLLH